MKQRVKPAFEVVTLPELASRVELSVRTVYRLARRAQAELTRSEQRCTIGAFETFLQTRGTSKALISWSPIVPTATRRQALVVSSINGSPLR